MSGSPAPTPPPPPTARPRGGLRPTRRTAATIGLLALVTLLVPLGAVFPALVLVVVAGGVLVDLVVACRARPAGRRSAVPTLALRVPMPFEIEATTHPARAARLRQPVPAELEVRPDEVPGGDLVGHLVGRHRGVHALPPAVVRVTGPLGLGSADHTVLGTDTVTVLPDLPKARRMADARRRGRSAESGRVRTHLGMGTEFESIRDYSPDDDVRRINWVASSRMGRPMSNQFRVDENREVLCVVDTGRLMASPVGGVTRLDVALDALTALAVAAEEAGDRVGALAFDAAVTRRFAPRRFGAEPLVRALFDLEPKEVESDYERAIIAVGQHKRALVALFTDLVDESASRSLLDACPMLSRHHAVLVAGCRDPDLESAVAAEPADVADVVHAALARDLLESHARLVARLRSMGVTVVTAAPGQLGAACVSAYLRMKQRARV